MYEYMSGRFVLNRTKELTSSLHECYCYTFQYLSVLSNPILYSFTMVCLSFSVSNNKCC